MLDKNVVVVRSSGAECAACEKKIPPRELSIRVSFNIPLVLTSTTVSKEFHLDCTEELIHLFKRRLSEADRGIVGK